MKLTEEEAKIICRYAASRDHIYRADACEIYHRHIAEHYAGNRHECPEMEFMGEILSSCPDLVYRAMLRKKITGE